MKRASGPAAGVAAAAILPRTWDGPVGPDDGCQSGSHDSAAVGQEDDVRHEELEHLAEHEHHPLGRCERPRASGITKETLSANSTSSATSGAVSSGSGSQGPT